MHAKTTADNSPVAINTETELKERDKKKDFFKIFSKTGYFRTSPLLLNVVTLLINVGSHTTKYGG